MTPIILPPVKFKDESICIKEQWKIFCRTLYVNASKMERRAEKEFSKSRKIGVPFIERKKIADKIIWCKKKKERIIKSVQDRPFQLDEEDYEIIDARGFEVWFRIYDDYFFGGRGSYPLDKSNLKEDN